MILEFVLCNPEGVVAARHFYKLFRFICELEECFALRKRHLYVADAVKDE